MKKLDENFFDEIAIISHKGLLILHFLCARDAVKNIFFPVFGFKCD